MTATVLQTLRMSRNFDATPEQVFDAWTDPKLVARWLFTGLTSEAHSAELDLRVGGRWKVTDRRDGVDYVAEGEYRVIDRPRRLVFSFGMPQFSPEFADVTVEFEASGDGCLMTLSQDKLPPEHVEPTEHGWSLMFVGLELLLKG
jgi:uncharacterized protein YndB with AHSA1/START domain